jgi:hypothetical protein
MEAAVGAAEVQAVPAQAEVLLAADVVGNYSTHNNT